MSMWAHHGKEGITMRLKPVGLVVMLALALLMVPLTVDAQPSGMVHRIGWLSAGPPPSAPDWRQTHPFLQGLRELGYSEGRNLVIEDRWAEGRFERLPDLAAELLRLQVEVIFAEGGVAVERHSRPPILSPSSRLPPTRFDRDSSPAWRAPVGISRG
jgi:hypothetical protein